MLLVDGVTDMLSDLESFSCSDIALSAVANATTTSEEPSGRGNDGTKGGIGGGRDGTGLTQDEEGRAGGQHDGPSRSVWNQRGAARLPGSGSQVAAGSEVNQGEKQPRPQDV